VRRIVFVLTAVRWHRWSVLSPPFVRARARRERVQFMVKDSKIYAAVGDWSFTQFDDGKPADEAVHNTCFSFQKAGKDRDVVLTWYQNPGTLEA
jgi:hypothetical protein